MAILCNKLAISMFWAIIELVRDLVISNMQNKFEQTTQRSTPEMKCDQKGDLLKLIMANGQLIK